MLAKIILTAGFFSQAFAFAGATTWSNYALMLLWWYLILKEPK